MSSRRTSHSERRSRPTFDGLFTIPPFEGAGIIGFVASLILNLALLVLVLLPILAVRGIRSLHRRQTTAPNRP